MLDSLKQTVPYMNARNWQKCNYPRCAAVGQNVRDLHTQCKAETY